MTPFPEGCHTKFEVMNRHLRSLVQVEIDCWLGLLEFFVELCYSLLSPRGEEHDNYIMSSGKLANWTINRFIFAIQVIFQTVGEPLEKLNFLKKNTHEKCFTSA